jgi:hypothetical protein
MSQMIIINFYKKYDTNWEELQLMALDVITKMENQSDEVGVDGLGIGDYYEDYRNACMLGMKTFIMMVLNEWEFIDILVLNGEFYKKNEYLEMDGILKKYTYPNLYKNSKELFSLFNKEKVQLTPENFDYIHETFVDDIICNVSSFEYELREIDEDNDLLNDNGFNDLLE